MDYIHRYRIRNPYNHPISITGEFEGIVGVCLKPQESILVELPVSQGYKLYSCPIKKKGGVVLYLGVVDQHV